MNRETVTVSIRFPRRLYDWLKEDALRLHRSFVGQAVYQLERVMVAELKESTNGADSQRDPAGRQDPAHLPE